MSKDFEFLNINSNDLSGVCTDKINNGWEIEFVTPCSLSLANIFQTYRVDSYQVLVSKDKKEV